MTKPKNLDFLAELLGTKTTPHNTEDEPTTNGELFEQFVNNTLNN